MSIAFKEWAVVCDALGRGTQSIIIRKGGIAEGRDGFRFKHEAFFLFPTFFHEQLARTKLPPETVLRDEVQGEIRIDLFATVEWTQLVSDPATVARLDPFHIWKPEIVEERFHYDEPAGVHLAVLRVARLSRPWDFPALPRYGGCRSWLQLPDFPDGITLEPVLDDATHAERVAAIREALAE